MNTDWYKTFFSGIVLDMWQRAVPEEQTAMETDFLLGALDAKPGERVLDVPCGGGRHSTGLAMRGLKVTGVDLSEEMLAHARERASAAGVDVEWAHGDMRDLPWRSEFDGACCLGNSFAYIDPAASRTFLHAVAATLKPGSRFVMDTGMVAESVLPRLREREWLAFDDILFLESNRYIPAESCVETTYTFIRDGKTDTRVGLQWVFTLREIRVMLDEAGLTTLSLLGSHDGAPYQAGSPLLIIVAERRPA